MAAAAAASTSSSSSTAVAYSESAATGSRCGAAAGVTGNGGWDEEEELEYEDGTGLTTALTRPPNPPEWALPFPNLSTGQSQSQSSLSSSGGTGLPSTRSQGRFFRQRQISFKLNAPEDMELAVIHCTLIKRREGVKNIGKHVPPRSITYGCLTLDSHLETQLIAEYAENL